MNVHDTVALYEFIPNEARNITHSIVNVFVTDCSTDGLVINRIALVECHPDRTVRPTLTMNMSCEGSLF